LKTENGPKLFGREPQTVRDRPLKAVKSPRVTMTAFRTGASSTGRSTNRSRAAPMMAATTRERTKAGQKLMVVRKLQAMNVLNRAISP
jgi:hypothetical protein